MGNDITFDKFQTHICQATIFTPDEEVSIPKTMDLFVKKWDHFFDSNPTMIEITPLPREIPKIVLKNKGDNWSCEISSAYVAVKQRTTVNSPDNIISTTEFYSTAIEILADYKAQLRARVDRMGAVINRTTPIDNAGRFLATHFCDKRWTEGQPFNRPDGFELHAHKVFDLNKEHRVNSWVRNITGMVKSAGATNTVIIIEQDINTLAFADHATNLTEDKLKSFFSDIPLKFDEILKLYYPSGDQT